MQEINTRRDAVQARRDGETPEGQRIALRNYNIQSGFNPLPPDHRRFKHEFMLLAFTGPGYTKPCNPDVGVILMGAFGSDTEGPQGEEMALRMARQFAVTTIAPNFQGVDIRAVPMDKWTLIAKDAPTAANVDYCIRRMDDNMAHYYTILKNNQSKFKRRVEETVKSLEQQLAAAERGLKEARDNLEAARREDTPDRTSKIEALKKRLAEFRAGEGVAMKQRCEALRKKIKRNGKAIKQLSIRHKAAEIDLKYRKQTDEYENSKGNQNALNLHFTNKPEKPAYVPPESAEDLEERLTEVKSYLDDAKAAETKLKAELEMESAKLTEVADSLQRQIVQLEGLSVAACEREVAICEDRHTHIKELTLRASVKDKINECHDSRIPMKAKEKKLEEQRIATMGLPVNQDKQKKVSARLEARRARIMEEKKDWQLLSPFPTYFLPRRQGCAAVCFLADCNPDVAKGVVQGEPMVRILKTYENKEEAEKDVEENLSKYITDFDIDVVDMGEWLFPEAVDYDKIEKFQFRDVQQQEVMQSRRRERKKVRDYETLCQQENLPSSELFLKEAEEGISMEEYAKQSQMQGTVEYM